MSGAYTEPPWAGTSRRRESRYNQPIQTEPVVTRSYTRALQQLPLSTLKDVAEEPSHTVESLTVAPQAEAVLSTHADNSYWDPGAPGNESVVTIVTRTVLAVPTNLLGSAVHSGAQTLRTTDHIKREENPNLFDPTIRETPMSPSVATGGEDTQQYSGILLSQQQQMPAARLPGSAGFTPLPQDIYSS